MTQLGICLEADGSCRYTVDRLCAGIPNLVLPPCLHIGLRCDQPFYRHTAEGVDVPEYRQRGRRSRVPAERHTR